MQLNNFFVVIRKKMYYYLIQMIGVIHDFFIDQYLIAINDQIKIKNSLHVTKK